MGRASREKRERKQHQREAAWEPLVRQTEIWNRATGKRHPLDDGSEFWSNSLYNVHVYRYANEVDDEPPLLHMAITRRDQAPARDWRHFQLIKNQMFGDEVEAIELFPAESRLVDSANTYHLWGIDDSAFRWPVGFKARLVMTPEELAVSEPGAVQRAFT